MWAWHAREAPRGRCVFDQKRRENGKFLYVGHERWCFHETAVLAVAYGFSEIGPCGLYLLYPDGRPPRLVSRSDHDLHCNISRDGRFPVVDTTGRHDAPGRGWESPDNKTSDIVLIERATGARRFLARSRLGQAHPSHPHPTFSPDGQTIFFNEADGTGTRNRVLMVNV